MNNNNNNGMADFDDRPISVYDNLNAANMATTTTTTATAATAKPPTMHTSTPKAKTIAAATTTTYEPYDEIPFKFDGNNNNNNSNSNTNKHKELLQQHLLSNGQSQARQQQQQQQHQHLLLSSQQQVPKAPQLTTTSTALYSTPIKPAIAVQIHATTAAAALPAAAAMACDASAGNAPAQRPLSQHSQTELSESSQSIAAIKAALNDAKSKFFGLNGYAPDTLDANKAEAHELLLQSANNEPIQTVQVQIVPPNTKPQPQYQNIPTNSAIYRQQLLPPPMLPPKPSEYQKSNSPDSIRLTATPSPALTSAATTPSPLSGRTSYGISTPPHSLSVSPTQDGAAEYRGGNIEQQQQLLPPTHAAAHKQSQFHHLDGPQPSQAVYMSTTVPQNIKGTKIAGRHTPTRNSLRHSRMLVVNNKNVQDTAHPNPMNFKQPNLARWLLVLQILLGSFIICLAIWIFFLAPNTAIQDNPYWSGIALLVAGIIGLVLIRYRRIKRHKVRENCFVFLRADGYMLSLAALLLCVVALICASIHFVRLTANDTRCVSTNMLLAHGSCSCTFNSQEPQRNASTIAAEREWMEEASIPEELQDPSYTVEYRDLTCQEVTGEWTLVLAASIVLNALGFISSFLYIILLACCRNNTKRLYTTVHTSTF